jgi:hypothetical protein
LTEFLFPHDEIDEADETEESDEDEEDDILAVVTAIDCSKAFLVFPKRALVLACISSFIVVVDGFEEAACSKKSNNSPKPVMGDHWFHSIAFPPPLFVFWVSLDAIVIDDEERAN